MENKLEWSILLKLRYAVWHATEGIEAICVGIIPPQGDEPGYRLLFIARTPASVFGNFEIELVTIMLLSETANFVADRLHELIEQVMEGVGDGRGRIT